VVQNLLHVGENKRMTELRLENGLLADYPVRADRYDELMGPDGIRPHWENLLKALHAMGPGELSARRADASRILEQEGVTYNIYGENTSDERPWPLDPLPLLLPSQEWTGIERSLMQAGELLDLMLKDLYGPKRLLKEGIIPPEALFSHPGFLRQCHSMPLAGGRYLSLFAADISRTPAGSAQLVSFRTQAPSGSGYALENRLVISRVLPSLFRDSHVHRLANYFRQVRSTLSSLSQKANPRVVLLTPGPGNETYFEHAFLAAYLGYTLVQAADLTVRDEKVWLRTLDSMHHVDVILRRVDDWFMDPLELKSDSLLGVPGLLSAMRAGNVAVANPPGAGIAESPAFLPFLGRICRFLLGEDLRLPVASTWWCGNESDRSHVLDRMENLVIKPVFRSFKTSTIYGRDLSAAERQELRNRIEASPGQYCAQEILPLSTSPSMAGSRLEPRSIVLRVFLTGRPDSYVVMPGGLARVSADMQGLVVSNQKGGVSKDVWILASEKVQETTLLSDAARGGSVSRSGGDVASRVAENLFWLGRYWERSDSMVRVLREIQLRILENEPGMDLNVLYSAVTRISATYPGFTEKTALAGPESEMKSLFYDRDRPGTLRFNICALASSARSIRDRLSDDSWKLIMGLEDRLMVDRPESEKLDDLVLAFATLAGLTSDSMSRGHGWRFLEMGRKLERSVQTNLLVQSLYSSQPGPYLLESLLRIKDSIKTYRRRYRMRLDPISVLDIVLLDESNPQAVSRQLAKMLENAEKLPRPPGSPFRLPEHKLILQASTSMRIMDIEIPQGKDSAAVINEQLMRLAEINSQLSSYSEALSNRYFKHVAPRSLQS